MSVLNTKQRVDYTFKFNKDLGRHGWLRLTPAYSVKLVEEIIHHVPGPLNILDPFSGTGTTPLCSAYHGHCSVGYELNPFLVWLAQAKIRNYSSNSILNAKNSLEAVLKILESNTCDMLNPPPIHNIERWWNKERLIFLRRLMWSIQHTCTHKSKEKDLLLVAFCRVMIDLSNAAFNHQSMSFKNADSNKHPVLFPLEPDYFARFETETHRIIDSAECNPSGITEILTGDSRELTGISDRRFDLLITSPPYPNRMSYIRELRPYMYWLGYLNDARQAGEMDWQAIGGTWGIATSRLNEWKPTAGIFAPDYLPRIVSEIAASDAKNSRLLSRYVAKYFEDIWVHLCRVHKVMRQNSKVHYIIGNSVFYDVTVPVEQIYKDMLGKIGFHDVQIKIIRKRNSKKALFEFDVSATT